MRQSARPRDRRAARPWPALRPGLMVFRRGISLPLLREDLPMTTAPHRTTALRQRMLQDLQLAGLSPRTQEAYLRAVRQLADHFRTPPDRLTEPQVRDYFLHLKNDRKFAPASLVI